CYHTYALKYFPTRRSSDLINKMMLMGGQSAMNVMIISNQYDEIMNEIHKTLHRGTTILEGVGGYSQEKRPVLMVVIVKKQLHDLDRKSTRLNSSHVSISYA